MIDQRLRSLVKGRSLGGFVVVFAFALAARSQGLAGCWVFRFEDKVCDWPVELVVAELPLVRGICYSPSGMSGIMKYSP